MVLRLVCWPGHTVVVPKGQTHRFTWFRSSVPGRGLGGFGRRDRTATVASAAGVGACSFGTFACAAPAEREPHRMTVGTIRSGCVLRAAAAKGRERMAHVAVRDPRRAAILVLVVSMPALVAT
jgi:hypothetical protein